MSQFTRVIKALESGKPGYLIQNEDNGREVEVACMIGGRYLCKDQDGEPVKQTNSSKVASFFLLGTHNLKDQRRSL